MKFFFLGTCILLSVAELFSQSVTISPSNISNISDDFTNHLDLISAENRSPTLRGIRSDGTTNIPTALTINKDLLSIVGDGREHNNTSLSALTGVAKINFRTTQNWATGAKGAAILFSTSANNTDNVIVRTMIDHNGNVGLGSFKVTDPPVAKLHIRQSDTFVNPSGNAKIFIEDSDHTYINFGVPDTKESGILFGRPTGGAASGGIIYDSNRFMHFRTLSNNTRMTISEAGNVGIGTSDPVAKLEVNGNAIMNGTLRVGTQGTVLVNIIKVTLAKATGNYAPGETKSVDFEIPNVVSQSTVTVTPEGDLPNGLIIQNARVSSDGNVTVKFYNATDNTIAQPTTYYNITVIK